MSTISTHNKHSIVLASLNLWCFYDWENRLPSIIKLLKEVKPDILFTQETQRNTAIDPRSQIEIINAELGYPYSVFAPADIKHQQKDKTYEYPVEHGLGILSQWPIKTEIIPLTKAEGDKEKRILLKCDAMINNQTYPMINVHFSNSDAWAESHFIETMKILQQENSKPILAGDFNIFDITKYKKLYGESHISSSEGCDYVSYPKDKTSFDYVLLPRTHQLESFVCRDEYVSDHRMIVAKIKLPS